MWINLQEWIPKYDVENQWNLYFRLFSHSQDILFKSIFVYFCYEFLFDFRKSRCRILRIYIYIYIFAYNCWQGQEKMMKMSSNPLNRNHKNLPHSKMTLIIKLIYYSSAIADEYQLKEDKEVLRISYTSANQLLLSFAVA